MFTVRGAKLKDVWGTFLTRRVVGTWNVLSGMVVEADTIVEFKMIMVMHMDVFGIEGYGLCAGRKMSYHQDIAIRYYGLKTLFVQYCSMFYI